MKVNLSLPNFASSEIVIPISPQMLAVFLQSLATADAFFRSFSMSIPTNAAGTMPKYDNTE